MLETNKFDLYLCYAVRMSLDFEHLLLKVRAAAERSGGDWLQKALENQLAVTAEREATGEQPRRSASPARSAKRVIESQTCTRGRQRQDQQAPRRACEQRQEESTARRGYSSTVCGHGSRRTASTLHSQEIGGQDATFTGNIHELQHGRRQDWHVLASSHQQQQGSVRCSPGMGEYRPERAWHPEQLSGDNSNVINMLHSIMDGLQPQGTSQYNLSEGWNSLTVGNWSFSRERGLCESAPLGLHLDEATKFKIWEGQFIDIFSFIQPEKESIDKPYKKTGDSNYKLKSNPGTINYWLHGFSVYASVLCEKFPVKGSSLFCYLELIWGAYRTYRGGCWLKFDEQFCQRTAARAYMCWDCQDMNLWLLIMTPYRPVTWQPGTGVCPQLLYGYWAILMFIGQLSELENLWQKFELGSSNGTNQVAWHQRPTVFHNIT
ncbi:hypothetical protein XELAEV_18022788mg [Xenopus laevis]|uniref:Uncharacterized protein n=1 Tax=Xenopus laevis TaxID=8355 RepID=A0A974HNQ7_XENLA|nr:hypothetical protein XELAEV_18022788mg [Xenopus laevis]